ncbi:putative late blight resistance protein homolog R1B-17 [Vitis vinifera]|uniref:putative late blight resistance protein homolog R1B-17 n=1 Tax=Vitis vinifera TaxID=29760 RepID=UPI0028831E65|nr:putative late blight resistance protein homolog R1B-17 [Vitis vinifera]
MERVVVAIWGMGGLGKTTLAKKVSNDTDVRHHLPCLGLCISRGKRYLIVLDDIWNTDVWRRLRSYFPAESNKSRVLITTRREDIAVDAHSDCYKLQLLGEKESWDLFLNKAGIAARKSRIMVEDVGAGPLQDHPFMVVNVETTWGDNILPLGPHL